MVTPSNALHNRHRYAQRQNRLCLLVLSGRNFHGHSKTFNASWSLDIPFGSPQNALHEFGFYTASLGVTYVTLPVTDRVGGQMAKVLSIVGAIAVGAVGMWLFRANSPKVPMQQPPLLSLQQMGHLVSVKVNYANIIEFTEEMTQDIPWTQWELRFGGTRVLLVARGDCLVGTDFRLAKYENANETARTAVLVLPPPKPISARVNHDPRENGGSYFYAINGTGFEPLIPGSANRTKAIDSALGMAQREIERVCTNSDVVATAKKNTEEVLRPAFSAIGWNVQVRWLQ